MTGHPALNHLEEDARAIAIANDPKLSRMLRKNMNTRLRVVAGRAVSHGIPASEIKAMTIPTYTHSQQRRSK